jgi:hypothetical protein
MSIQERLKEWQNDFNPMFSKDYKIISNSFVENDTLYQISIAASFSYQGICESITISKYSPTHSNSKPNYLKGDLYDLNKLIDWMEQNIQLQRDEIISKIDL